MRTVLAILALCTSIPAFAYDTAHVAEAMSWVDAIDPANNDYGDPPSITFDASGEPTLLAKCGSAQGLIFKETYAGITDTVLSGLTGESSPHAVKWYNAILAGASSGGYSLAEVDGDALNEGDLLVTAGATGHVDHAMLVESVTDVTLAKDSIGKAYKAGPTGTTAILLVGVIDASETPHGPDPANPRPETDTRYIYQDAANTPDQGIGYGEILVYTDADGEIIGWRWSVISSTLHIQSGTAGTGQTVRPLVAGRMSGPGL